MMARAKSNAYYGVNIKKYCAEHEEYVLRRLGTGEDLDELLLLHKQKILWLQHERLAHLIVTLLISIVFLFSIYLCIAQAGILVFLLVFIVLILLGAYIRHYFFLENRVHYWYKLYDRIYNKIQ